MFADKDKDFLRGFRMTINVLLNVCFKGGYAE